MADSPQPMLLDLGPNQYVSREDDLEGKVADYTDKLLLAPPLEARVEEIMFGSKFRSPYQAYEAGLLSRGQWLLLVLGTFYVQVTNGGVAQFLVNKTDLVEDVAIALDFLGLNEFAASYRSITEPILMIFRQHRDSAGPSTFQQIRAQDRDFRSILAHTNDCEIDRQFTMQWDNERGLIWPADGWAQNLLRQLVGFIEKNPGEFQRLYQ